MCCALAPCQAPPPAPRPTEPCGRAPLSRRSGDLGPSTIKQLSKALEARLRGPPKLLFTVFPKGNSGLGAGPRFPARGANSQAASTLTLPSF